MICRVWICNTAVEDHIRNAVRPKEAEAVQASFRHWECPVGLNPDLWATLHLQAPRKRGESLLRGGRGGGGLCPAAARCPGSRDLPGGTRARWPHTSHTWPPPRGFLGGYHFGITACSKRGTCPCRRRRSWCRAFPSSLKSKLVSMPVLRSPPWWPNPGCGWKRRQIHLCWTLWELQGYRNWETQGWEVQTPAVSGIIPNSPPLILEVQNFFSLCTLSLCLSWVWHQRNA